MDLVSIATVLSTLLSAIAIIEALYISKKSSKDIKQMVIHNKIDTNNQITAYTENTNREIAEVRILSRTLITSVLSDLRTKDNLYVSQRDTLVSEYKLLLDEMDEALNMNLITDNVLDFGLVNQQKDRFVDLEKRMRSLSDQLVTLLSQIQSNTSSYDMLKPAIDTQKTKKDDNH